MTTISLRLDENVERELTRRARAEKTTKSNLLRQLIREHLLPRPPRKTPWELARDLIPRVGSGIEDLGSAHQRHLQELFDGRQSHR